MSYSSFDPRKEIRETIGTAKAINPDSWDEQYCLSITHEGIDYDIPIYMSEESRSDELPTFPFIDMNIMEVSYDPHDVGATTRKSEAYIDIGFWFTSNDEINATDFGKDVIDQLINRVRTEQQSCSYSGIHYVYVRNVRLLRENQMSKQTQGRQVVYHYVVEIYAIYYD